MRIKKIRVDSQEGTDKIFYSGRSVTIDIDSARIEGPGRISTTTEFNSLQKIPSERVSIPSSLSINPKKLYANEYPDFISGQGIHKKIANYLISKVAPARYSKTIITPIWSAETCKVEKRDIEKFTRRSHLIQQEVKQSLGRSCDLFLFSTFFPKDIPRSLVNDIFEEQNKEDLWVPVISMRMNKDLFKYILDNIYSTQDTYQIPFTIFLYGDPLEYLENYDYIWEHRESNIINLLCDCPREKLNDLSTAHYLHAFGMDLIGRMVYHTAGPPRIDRTPPHLKVKYFDRKDLTVSQEYRKTGSFDLLNEIPHDNRIKMIVENRSLAVNQKDVDTLKSISNVHEFHASTDELRIARRFIDHQEFDEYFKNKDRLKNALDLFIKDI